MMAKFLRLRIWNMPQLMDYEPSVEDAVVFENPIMQPAERDLLTFILKDGLTELNFPDDTEFYDPDSKFYSC